MKRPRDVRVQRTHSRKAERAASASARSACLRFEPRGSGRSPLPSFGLASCTASCMVSGTCLSVRSRAAASAKSEGSSSGSSSTVPPIREPRSHLSGGRFEPSLHNNPISATRGSPVSGYHIRLCTGAEEELQAVEERMLAERVQLRTKGAALPRAAAREQHMGWQLYLQQKETQRTKFRWPRWPRWPPLVENS